MPEIVGIRFKHCGKIYNFEVNGIAAKPGMRVVVESEMGLSLGTVVTARREIEQPEQPLKKVLRIATVPDIETDKNNRLLEEEAKTFCIEKAKNHNLPMKVVGTEATLDKKRLIFYFTAEGRIDFRELVRDLASRFRTRIEMRQIGVRDEIKFLGGIGICGREVCCKTFLTFFDPVSMRMAKKQKLFLNPGKLSGICGRLMCCLSYEIDQLDKEDEDLALQEEVMSLGNGVESVEESIGVSEESILIEDATLQEEKRDNASQPYDSGVSSGPKEPEPVGRQARPVCRQARFVDTQRKTILESTCLPTGRTHVNKPDRGKPFSKRKKFWEKRKRR